MPADSSLVLAQNLTGRPVTLADYTSGAYKAASAARGMSPDLFANLVERQYTSMADLKLIERFFREFRGAADKVAVRYCRFARIEDFKSGNAVLIGVKQANPWVELFEEKLNFRFEYAVGTSGYKVINRNPQAGERSAYLNLPDDPQHRIYASVALLPNLTGTGKVLILQGTTMAGTEAAVDFVFHDEGLERALGSSASLPGFEIFLESAVLANNAREARVLSVRKGAIANSPPKPGQN